MSGICDCHVHFIPEVLSSHTTFYKGIWADKTKLFQFLEANAVEKALLVYPSTDAEQNIGSVERVCELYNSALERMVQENPRIIPAGLVDIDDQKRVAGQVKELGHKGFKTISIASSQQGAFILKKLEPLFEAAAAQKMAVFVHPQTTNPIGFERVKDPLLMPVLEYSFDIAMFLGLLMMEGVLERYNIKFIFSSLAGVTPFLKDRFDRVYAMLRARQMVKDLGAVPSEILRKVYVDTSGASLKNIQLALELFGEDNVLWGSDYPVAGDVRGQMEMLGPLGWSAQEKISGNNFRQIFCQVE